MPPYPTVLVLLPPPRGRLPGVAQDPKRCRGRGGVSAPGALARPRGDRKPGHRGLSLAAAAQPQPGRKFCRVLSAGASLAILLNRKPGSAGAERWRRERRTPSPRAPAGTSGGEASEWTPRGARAAPDREGAAEPRVVAGVPQVVGPHPGAPGACQRSHRAGTGAARARGRPCGTGPPTHRENGRGEGRPPSWGRKGPSADPGVGAAVARVAGAVDAGNLLAKGSSSNSRDPPRSPLSSPSLRSSRVREGDEARVSSPLGPSSCALVCVSAVGTLSELFQARLSCSGTGPGGGRRWARSR